MVLSLRFAAETVLTTISGQLLHSLHNALRLSLSCSASPPVRRLVVHNRAGGRRASTAGTK